MSILTLIFIAMMIVAVVNGRSAFTGDTDTELAIRRIGYIKSVGLFGLIFGILGQLIGLYSAFSAIEQVGSVSPALLAGGLKVSTITTLYGLFIYVLSYLIWLGLSFKLRG